jgi:hypothetical protein
MPLKSTFSLKNTIVFLPWVFILVIAIVAWRTMDLISSTMRDQAANATLHSPNAAELAACIAAAGTPIQAPALQSCLEKSRSTAQAFDDDAKPRLDELKWMLTIIGSLGAFFVIAQAGAAWFTAQVYTKQAEDGLARIAEVQKAVTDRYPLFAEVERLRDKAFQMLDKAFDQASKAKDTEAGSTEALDWKDNLYRKLGVEGRQLLLSVESFASIDLHPGPFNQTEHADVLTKFALFYRSKFLYEDALYGGLYSDLERAESYLRLSYEKKPDFTTRNELGSLYLAYYQLSLRRPDPGMEERNRRILHHGRELFEASLRLEPNQQRAQYNLAVIEAKYGDDQHPHCYAKAADRLKNTLRLKSWQRGPSDYMRSIIHYNIACYTAQNLVQVYRQQAHSTSAPSGQPITVNASQASPSPAVTVADCAELMHHLNRSIAYGSVRKELITYDFEDPNGDFAELQAAADPQVVHNLTKLKEKMIATAERARTQPVQQSTRERIRKRFGFTGAANRSRAKSIRNP